MVSYNPVVAAWENHIRVSWYNRFNSHQVWIFKPSKISHFEISYSNYIIVTLIRDGFVDRPSFEFLTLADAQQFIVDFYSVLNQINDILHKN